MSSNPKEKATEDRVVAVEAVAPVEYLQGARLAAVTLSLMLSMFLVSLDNVC
jgi:hypothetical protein